MENRFFRLSRRQQASATVNPLLYIQRVDLPRFSQRPEMTGYVRKIKKPVPLPPPVILTLPQRSG